VKRILSSLSLCLLAAACATRPVTDHVALPPAPPPGEPTSTEGMTAQALRASYGNPAFTRKDGETQLWRYDGATCKAFFFLYPDGGELKVRHVETSPRPVDAAADQICLHTLAHHPQTPVS